MYKRQILGLSGGVDSAYMLYLANKLGLRVLAVHVDSGWNSEMAVSNIEKMCQKLDVRLHTYVMAVSYTHLDVYKRQAYETASPGEKDYAAALAALPRISWQGHCMYCGHCAPCPSGISVAEVTKFLNLARAQGETPETVREHYRALSHHASECVRCGACEKRCPFGVPVRENMAQATEIFGY